MELLIFYIAFSYLYMLGVSYSSFINTGRAIVWYNLLFTPIFFPIMLGMTLTNISNLK